MPKTIHPRINKVLAALAAMLSVYIVLAPLLPELVFAFQSHSPGETVATVSQAEPDDPKQSAPADVVLENRLQVPSIGVDGQIFEGTSAATLEKGVWHRPKTSTPDKGGNTVLVAHRYLYRSGPNTFYHLDKVKVGEKLVVWWQKQKLEYIVGQVYETTATDLGVEAPSLEPRLTLYTCTPLFSAERRLVVVAFPTKL